MNDNIEDIRQAAQDIMKERSTQADKREKLLKIGLTNSDIQQLFFAERLAKKMARQEREAARTAQQLVEDTIEQILSRYTFGVEIECYNAQPVDVVLQARERGLAMQSERYNHTDNDRYYKLVSDCSIRGNDPIECVSPVLNGGNTGFDSLKTCCDVLNAIGAKVNRSTGLHVHVGGNITEQQYCNTFVNYYYLEGVINKFMSASRRYGNQYCKPLRSINERALLDATTIEDVLYAMRQDRYYKINACSWSRHHTIEFRQHQGTTEYKKISNWARFCIKLVHWSADHRLTAHVSRIEDIEFLTDEEKRYFDDRACALA